MHNNDPDTYYEEVPVPMIRDIEGLIEARKKASTDGRIESEKDFDVLIDVYNVWRKYFPNDYQTFVKSAAKIRTDINLAGTKGISKGAGEAAIQHQMEVPQKLHEMIIIIFPNHKYDRKFVRKFVDKLPEFKVTDAKI